MKYLTMLACCIAPLFCTAQELEFSININTPRLQNTNADYFKSLEGLLIEFLNNRRWTNDTYDEHEKIQCNLNLTIRDEMSATSFGADLDIQASRPVYGTNYETTLINHRDPNVIFSYEDSRPLIFTDNAFNDNLTSILAFYVYYILGMDYDSFSLYGGDEHFEKAQEIITTLPPEFVVNDPGWRSTANGKNRYFMIENILNPRSRNFRKATYNYHRQGLDIMAGDSDQAKEVLVAALKDVESVNNDSPNSMIIQMFANAKAEEVAEIFSIAIREQKNEVYRIMTRIDPANRNKYISIRR